MENKLEQLLNSLVDAGWKPRGLLNEIEYIHAFDDVNQGWRVEISYGEHGYYKSLRQIASRESNLWQFVCENKMVMDKNSEDEDVEEFFSWTKEYYCEQEPEFSKRMGVCDDSGYEYRLIESALCDEDKLEEFLLNSISLHE